MPADHLPEESEKYEILETLGRGGMGEVYLARDTRLGRKVAIKVLRRDLTSDALQQQLQQEAKLLAQLNHPNIVQIFDLISHEGKPALVMEYVHGRNLHIHLREHRVELADKLRWLSEISAGVAASHAAGIAHCDLKAENVLINEEGVAKVTDYGIATEHAKMSDDILALGILAESLLKEHQTTLSPLAQELIAQLKQRNASKRPTGSETARQFRLYWHELSQSETPLPELPTSNWQPRPLHLAIAAGLFAVLGIGALLLSRGGPAPRSYVASMPTVITAATGLSERQQQLMQSTVQQSLQQSVIDTAEQALISSSETAQLQGTPSQIAHAVDADVLISSTLNCNSNTCDLSIERRDAPTMSVSAQRAVTLLVNSPLESHEAIQRQWHHLFPNVSPLRTLSDLISEADYRSYLTLYQAAKQYSMPTGEILSQVEALLGRAGRFLPLYRLYADVAMDSFAEMGEEQYLDRLETVLTQANTWAAGSIFLQRSWFDLAIARKNYDRAESIIAEVRTSSGDEIAIEYLTGELFFEFSKYEQAESHYKRAATLHPGIQIIYARARNLFFWGEHPQALDVLNSLLERYPYHTPALTLQALIYLEHGDVDAAISAFERSIEIQPDALTRANLGLAYLMRKDYGAAREQFLAAYEADSRDSVIVLNLADTELLLGNEARAKELYQNIVSRSSQVDYSVDPTALAQAYAQLGHYPEALTALQKMDPALQAGIGHAFSAALVYTLAGQNIAAMVEIDRALSGGLSALWFDLAWFDPLCSETGFRELLAEAGSAKRCELPPTG